MLQVVSTGAYYPPVDTTWKILTTGASQLTAGALCTGLSLPAVVGDSWKSAQSESHPPRVRVTLSPLQSLQLI